MPSTVALRSFCGDAQELKLLSSPLDPGLGKSDAKSEDADTSLSNISMIPSR